MSSTVRRILPALALAALAVNITACGPAPYLVVQEPMASTAPAEGMARVYFVMVGGYFKATAIVTEEKSAIGYLQNGTWFYVDVPAGKHMFLTENAGNMSALELTADAGKSYFLRLAVTPGYMSNHVYLIGVCQDSEDWGNRQAWLDKWNQIKENPEYTDAWEIRYAGKLEEALAKVAAGDGKATIIGPECGE